MKKITFYTLLFLTIGACREEVSPDNSQIRNEILKKGQSAIWALNEGNVDTLMSQYWESDAAFFMINGRKIQGYDEVKSRLIQSMEYRKKLALNVVSEDVVILSPTSATHVIEFDQKITDLDDITTNYKGLWTAVYQKMEEDWKTVFVHESYYPMDN